jgi:hypothetical protein
MAIKDMKGTVSTGKPAITMTGMMNQKPNIPDMSKMKMPVAQKKKFLNVLYKNQLKNLKKLTY